MRLFCMLGDDRKLSLCLMTAVFPICSCDFAISSHVLISAVVSPSDDAAGVTVTVAVGVGASVGVEVGSLACVSVGDGTGDDVVVGGLDV